MKKQLSSQQEQFRAFCLEHGCKCTPQRFAVYQYMSCHPGHPCVNEVWEEIRREIPSITRESVFRILCELADFGKICRLDSFTNARFDAFPESHGHLVCEKCGAVVDFPLPPEMALPRNQGFQPRRMELRVSGLCAECAAKQFEKF